MLEATDETPAREGGRARDLDRAHLPAPRRPARLADLREPAQGVREARRRRPGCRRSRSRHGKRTETATGFHELRAAALDLAKEGIHVSRFKGLGEMNPEQLWETTMDPARRLLIRVDVEDASRRRPGLLDADGRPGRAAPRVHRGEREGREVPAMSEVETGPAEPRPDRGARARAGDALELPRLRDVGDRLARAARRARRAEAGAPARALRDARGRDAAEPAVQEVRAHRRRRDGRRTTRTATRRSTTRSSGWRSRSRCATRSSTGRATSARSTTTRRRRCATPSAASTRLATELLRDIDADTVDFGPNYDESRKEPSVLPARFPNLLVNGSAGIAVGMATNIPPHHLARGRRRDRRDDRRPGDRRRGR